MTERQEPYLAPGTVLRHRGSEQIGFYVGERGKHGGERWAAVLCPGRYLRVGPLSEWEVVRDGRVCPVCGQPLATVASPDDVSGGSMSGCTMHGECGQCEEAR